MKIGYLDSIIQRIPIKRPCKGYYLRWYYNGWHYWFFLPGEMNMDTEGEQYRTIGTKKIAIGSGHLTYSQAQAIRTIILTREVYLLTEFGWKHIRIFSTAVLTLQNIFPGYEMEFVMTIGSKEISTVTGYTPVPIIPVIDPVPDPSLCEIIVGTQIWACKNYDSEYPGSKHYNNDGQYHVRFGKLYSYDQITASGFTPPGWHIPTLAEWDTLIAFIGGEATAGKIKSLDAEYWNAPNTGAANAYGFDLRGAGYYVKYFDDYFGLREFGIYWTSDSYSPTQGRVVGFKHNAASVYQAVTAYGDMYSVRLIKDIPAESFADWFLPSKDELTEVYNELVIPGIIPALDQFWCSSEYDATMAYKISFFTGLFDYTNKIVADLAAYACRSFTAIVGAYSLRDIGPAGGRIFYINGTTYYELYMTPFGVEDHYHWSNIALLVGTGTAIGTGRANTTAIIAQDGHTGSAAKLCDDLIIYV